MPIGIVSDSDFDLELERSNKVQRGEVRNKIPLGRGINHVEVPESLRKIIGETSEINGREDALNLASKFGISPSSVSAYANGATSTTTYHQSNPDLKKHINNAKEQISNKAKNRLISALDEITPEKLAEAKLRDVSSIARDMSAIIKDLEPEDKVERSETGPTFVFYSPQMKKEDSFETIDMSNE